VLGVREGLADAWRPPRRDGARGHGERGGNDDRTKQYA
jgi:hypothetical protein